MGALLKFTRSVELQQGTNPRDLVCAVVRTERGEPERYFREVVMAYEGDECLTWPYSKDGGGYGQMRRDGRLQTVSRLVCEHVFGPPPSPKDEAAHSCAKGHLACVTKGHLSWKTRKGNCEDRLIHGTHPHKLDLEEVREIRALRGRLSQRKIAAKFGLSSSTVSDIQNGKKWAWLA